LILNRFTPSLIAFERSGNRKAGTMAKVILNPMIKELRGAMGDVVYRTSPNGMIYISKRPDMSRVKWSKAQKGARQRFKEASKYAKAAMADPEVRAVYEKRAAKEQRIPYRVALSDYLNGKDLFSKK
jgi:hypothetical protein